MEPEYAAEKDLLKGEMKRERKGSRKGGRETDSPVLGGLNSNR